MSLSDIIKKTAKKTLVSAALASAPYTTNAETIYIDQSWIVDNSPTLVNNILDGDPNTFGKDGQADVQPGDRIVFRVGNGTPYTLGLGKGVFAVKVPNITIEGEDMFEVVFRRTDYNDPLSFFWNVQTNNVELKNFSTTHAHGAILFQRDFEGGAVRNVFMNGHVIGVAYNHEEAEEETLSPSIIVDGVYFKQNPDVGGVGVHFQSESRPSKNVKYAGIYNCTADGITVFADPPVYVENNRGYVKGDFHSNFGDAPYHSLALRGWKNNPSPFIFKRFAPNSLEEFIMPTAQRSVPQGSYEIFSAQNRYGEKTLYIMGIQPDNGMLNYADNFEVMGVERDERGLLRPVPGSILINEGFRKGYCGALPPKGFVRKIEKAEPNIEKD